MKDKERAGRATPKIPCYRLLPSQNEVYSMVLSCVVVHSRFAARSPGKPTGVSLTVFLVLRGTRSKTVSVKRFRSCSRSCNQPAGCLGGGSPGLQPEAAAEARLRKYTDPPLLARRVLSPRRARPRVTAGRGPAGQRARVPDPEHTGTKPSIEDRGCLAGRSVGRRRGCQPTVPVDLNRLGT